MRRMRSLILVAVLMIVVILAGAIALAGYRSAIVEVEGHEHTHGMEEHADSDVDTAAPPEAEEAKPGMSEISDEAQTDTPAYGHEGHKH